MRFSNALAISASFTLFAATANASRECWEAQKALDDVVNSDDDYYFYEYADPVSQVVFDIVERFAEQLDSENSYERLQTICPDSMDPGNCDYTNDLEFVDGVTQYCDDLGGRAKVVYQDIAFCKNLVNLLNLKYDESTPDYTFKNAPLCLPLGDACFPDGDESAPVDMTQFLQTGANGEPGVLPRRFELLFDPYVCENACEDIVFNPDSILCTLENNSRQCAYDVTRCDLYNQYPTCPIALDSGYAKLGDGKCHNDPESNTEECEFDGGDCVQFNIDYPECTVYHGSTVGDGICNSVNNNEGCKFDGGDCAQFNIDYPTCSVMSDYPVTSDDHPFLPGDGICEQNGNFEECGFDGGDCVDFNTQYPYCDALGDPGFVGDGKCQKWLNTADCGFDGGDCDEEFNDEFNVMYPDCNAWNPFEVGDGRCHRSLNITDCGLDGGDCAAFNEQYPDCNVDRPDWIGDNICDDYYGDYNTPECDFDGGDCGGGGAFDVTGASDGTEEGTNTTRDPNSGELSVRDDGGESKATKSAKGKVGKVPSNYAKKSKKGKTKSKKGKKEAWEYTN